MATVKTHTERTIAFAFPEMINSSIDDDTFSVVSVDVDGYSPNDAAGSKSTEKFGSQKNHLKAIEWENNKVPSTPDTVDSFNTTVEAHSEWLTPTGRRMENENEGDPNSQSSKKSACVTVWDLLLLIALSLVVAIGVWVVVIVVGTSTSTGSDNIEGSHDSIRERPLNPIVDRLNRLQNISKWLDIENSPPNSKSPQGRALEWLASSDITFILGAEIPSKIQYELYIQESHTKNNSDFVNDDHKNMNYFYIHLTQRYALLVLAFATGIESQFGGWASMSGARLHECIWPGIVCRDYDIVTAIDIDPTVTGGKYLSGSIPTEIGLLGNLDRLFLTYNQLSGELPQQIYYLSNLYSLRLSKTNLNSTLSDKIAQLNRLEFLDLTNGQFYGTIPSQLGEMTNLKFVFFASNLFEGSLPSDLGMLTGLEKLAIQHTSLSGTMPSQMCKLRKSSRLEALSANCNAVVSNNSSMSIIPGLVVCDCCTNCF